MLSNIQEDLIHFCRYVDEFNNPIKRTPSEYSYSYDGYIIYRSAPNDEVNATVWSDRIYQQDSTKFNHLCLKHFGDKGQYFSDRDPKLIQSFLSEYFDKPELKLIFIMQYCNRSSGYPLWRFAVNYKQ